MVVDAATIVADGLDLFAEKVASGITEEKSTILSDLVDKLKSEDKYSVMKEVLVPDNYNLIVTPKEIDDLIENMKDVVARGINFSL